jgi:Protein of unknown function (DUF3176)
MGKYGISVQQIPVYSKGAEKPIHKENSIPELTGCSNDRRSHQWYSLGKRVFHEWKWEIGALLISILTLMAIIITLSNQNGKVAPNLPSGINLNSLIAILTTILRIAILVVISEGEILQWSEGRKVYQVLTIGLYNSHCSVKMVLAKSTSIARSSDRVL